MSVTPSPASSRMSDTGQVLVTATTVISAASRPAAWQAAATRARSALRFSASSARRPDSAEVTRLSWLPPDQGTEPADRAVPPMRAEVLGLGRAPPVMRDLSHPKLGQLGRDARPDVEARSTGSRHAPGLGLGGDDPGRKLLGYAIAAPADRRADER